MPNASSSAPGYWVDTDIALGAAAGDVDDGFALAAIARHCQAGHGRLLGVSAVAGNTDASTAERCARDLLNAMSLTEVPVLPASEAAAAIAGLPAGSRIVALGPLSNIAEAIRLDPALPDRSSLHLVGSVLRPWRQPLLLAYDLNFKRDRAAAAACLAAPFARRTVCPLDVVRRLAFGPAELAHLQAAAGPAAYLAQHARRWARQSLWRYGAGRFPVWDLVAALDAIGLLPGARHTDDGSLEGFDAEAARQQFLQLMGAGR